MTGLGHIGLGLSPAGVFPISMNNPGQTPLWTGATWVPVGALAPFLSSLGKDMIERASCLVQVLGSGELMCHQTLALGKTPCVD